MYFHHLYRGLFLVRVGHAIRSYKVSYLSSSHLSLYNILVSNL